VSELFRIVEDQAKLSSYRATQNEDEAVQLELAIELTKPKNYYHEWHDLIATPFRYSPPHKIGRFRAAFSKNVFYGSLSILTSYYEYAYHFIFERRHLKISPETGKRTLFSVHANPAGALHIHDHEHLDKLIHKSDYSYSHQFIETNPDTRFIIYPSCRDPNKGNNAAVLDINLLDKQIHHEASIKYFYDNEKQEIFWMDAGLHIGWREVA
jgi:hypothetical protein